MRKSSRGASRLVEWVGLAVLAAFVVDGRTVRAHQESSSPEGRASGLRIYRALDRNGRQVVVLTNLDDQGNRLPSPPDERVPEAPIATERCQAPARASEEPAPVGSAPAQERDGGGATIVININNAPLETAPDTVYALPTLGYGGLVGPFRYPENHHFLGYGTGISSPSLFGGLGLNPGNRFGLKTGTPCAQGYDCMFGPDGGR